MFKILIVPESIIITFLFLIIRIFYPKVISHNDLKLNWANS